MKTPTLMLEVQLYGGLADGEVLEVDADTKQIERNGSFYKSAFSVNYLGQDEWYCFKGDGKLTRMFINETGRE